MNILQRNVWATVVFFCCATIAGGPLPFAAATASAQQSDSPILPEPVPRGAGGGAVADFSALMELIQRTIVPDTWEQVGGPSSLFPYPGGVYVDSQGLLQDKIDEPPADQLAELRQVLLPETASADQPIEDWMQPAPLRCVSLRRLSAELKRQQQLGNHSLASWPTALQHMAGLSEIRYVMLDPDSHDIVMAGPVGGIEIGDGWTVDRESGHAVLLTPWFAAALRAASRSEPFGCSIDPTPHGIAEAMAVAEKIERKELAVASAADAMRQALGRQPVRYFGTSGDQPLAWLLVEADRHMKRLALGAEAMPAGVPNYLDAIDRYIADGAPNGQLLRLWFTGAPMAVRSDSERLTFELSGTPLRLASENQVPDRFGGRRHADPDIRLQSFVQAFNRDLPKIVDRHPLYGALISVYRAAAVAQLIYRHADPLTVQESCGALLDESLHQAAGFAVPRHVESLAVMHTVRHGRQRHHVLVASGGVWVEPQTTLAETAETYPRLADLRPRTEAQRLGPRRWWWDVR